MVDGGSSGGAGQGQTLSLSLPASGLGPADLAAIRVRATSGELVPLSNLVTLSEVAEAGTLNRFNRLRSITINAGLAPGYPLGEAIAWAQQVTREELPSAMEQGMGFDGSSITDATAGMNTQNGQWVVNVVFDADGAGDQVLVGRKRGLLGRDPGLWRALDVQLQDMR